MEGTGLVATDTGSNVLNGVISGATWSTTNNVGIQTDFGRGALTLAPNTTNAKDGLWFGYDNNLYRSAASVISSDSKLDPASLNIQVKAGVPADADIVGGASSGDIVLDTSDSRIYVRNGATWMYAAVAAGFQIPTIETYAYDFSSKAFDISKPIAEGDLLIPFADKTMSDGAMHGLYTTFDSVKQTMFNSFEQDYDTLASNYIATKSDNALTKIDGSANKINTLELSLNDLTTRVDALTADASFVALLKSFFSTNTNTALNSLTMTGDLEISGGIAVEGNAKFGGDVEVSGHTILSSDSVGQAVFAAGENKVEIKYAKSYAKQPTVFVNANGKNLQFKVSDESIDGFTIELADPAVEQTKLNWLVVGTR
jgi:phage baseplate assembly protein gpV